MFLPQSIENTRVYIRIFIFLFLRQRFDVFYGMISHFRHLISLHKTQIIIMNDTWFEGGYPWESKYVKKCIFRWSRNFLEVNSLSFWWEVRTIFCFFRKKNTQIKTGYPTYYIPVERWHFCLANKKGMESKSLFKKKLSSKE